MSPTDISIKNQYTYFWDKPRMLIIVQRNATIYSLFIAANRSTCSGWWHYPSSREHITVFTVSGTGRSVWAASSRYRGWIEAESLSNNEQNQDVPSWAGSGCSILILLASSQQTCMTYTIAVCTVKNSLWWTEELSEACRVSFQNKVEKLVHPVVFIIRIKHDSINICNTGQGETQHTKYKRLKLAVVDVRASTYPVLQNLDTLYKLSVCTIINA